MPPGYVALQLDLVNRRRENFIRKRPGKIDLVEAVARQQRGSFREGLVWQKGDRNRGEVAKVDVAAQSEIGVSLSKVCEINNRIPAFEGDAPGQAESVEKLTVDQIHAAGDQRLLQRIGRNQVATQDSPGERRAGNVSGQSGEDDGREFYGGCEGTGFLELVPAFNFL